MAIHAWNLLGGVVDWTGLPIVAEMLGINDIELLIRQLRQIQQFKLEG